MNLAGVGAFVTGGASGPGCAVVELATHGAKVAIFDLRPVGI